MTDRLGSFTSRGRQDAMPFRVDCEASSPLTPRFVRLLLGVTVLVLAGGAAACRTEDAVRAVPGHLSGTYRLESLNGVAVPTSGLGAVLSGEIVLEADGHATRRFRQQLSGVADKRDVIVRGTFVAISDTLVFAFVEDPKHPEYVWRPRATLADGRLTLRFAGPTDGPESEVYRGPER